MCQQHLNACPAHYGSSVLCIALTRVCEAIRKCHGTKLVGVTLLTLRSEPGLESVLFFVDIDMN